MHLRGVNYFVCRFAVDKTKMTLIPLSSSVNAAAVGSQSVLSQYDIQTLAKAYSCAGRVATNAGGNSQVIFASKRKNKLWIKEKMCVPSYLKSVLCRVIA
jgi:hypothetical protein